MSYDLGLISSHGCVESFNITFNIRPMLDEAVGMNLKDLNRMPGRQVANIINWALIAMLNDAETFRVLEDPGGWGTLEQFYIWLQRLRDFCDRYPYAVLYVTG